MHSITKIFLISIGLVLASCQSKPVNNVIVNVNAMPPEPEWVVFTRKPIIEKKENDFVLRNLMFVIE